MSEALVIVEGLEKSFQHMERTLDVLRGIDLNIYAGQILAIVGASGAGKSTLLHCIGTLDLPSKGRIRLAGEELTTMSSARLAASRAACTAGSNKAIKTPMIAITTNNSISVKARRSFGCFDMTDPSGRRSSKEDSSGQFIDHNAVVL